MSAACAAQTTMNPLTHFGSEYCFHGGGNGREAGAFGLVSAAVCGEAQMPSVNVRAGCGSCTSL